jgi:hypothetical protein
VTRTPDKDRNEFNQLKYVVRAHIVTYSKAKANHLCRYINKQLYAETAGLEVKYSKIIIERSRLVNLPPKVLLICWRRSASAAKRTWIDQANIHEDDFWTESYGPMNV